MSRIGKKPISVPAGVKLNIAAQTITVEGPKGKLSFTARREVQVKFDKASGQVEVTRQDDARQRRALHGLTRALVANMVHGVTEGYSKTLEIYGTGYGVKMQGKKVAVNVGFANIVEFDVSQDLQVDIQTPQSRSDTQPAIFTISGADKQKVGDLAARIRRTKKPEPYKGKGIRYKDEHVRRKAGKAFASGAQ